MLFVIDSLHCAGAEKSLINLLTLIDYSKYEVDLQLFGYGGDLEKILPANVSLLRPLEYTDFSKKNIRDAISYAFKERKFKMLQKRIKFSLSLRKKSYSAAQNARLFWQNISSVIEVNHKKYDIAISYAQGVPTFYVAEKVNAIRKYAWVNVSYRLEKEDKDFQEKFYDNYNKIVAVSDSAKNIFLETFPKYKKKLNVIYDIINSEVIYKMAKSGESYTDKFNGIRILTVGRLSNQKGYDIAIESCKILKELGVNFKWYSLGIGPLKDEIEKCIHENELEEHFELLGVKANPYPFIKDCDIYVQTSKYEGFGLAIAEARILNKPLVTTKFDAVYNQMIDRKNGLVVDMNAKSVANGILELINNKKLTNDIIEYLKKEKKGNVDEVYKFYKLIE